MVANSKSEIVAKAIDWQTVSTWQEAAAALGQPVLEGSDVFGDGASFIKDKAKLVGVPFLILEWHYVTDEETQRQYVNLHIMNEQGQRARFNDGSTGIYAQVVDAEARGAQAPIVVRNGLRRSDYVTEVDGKKQSATTFYLT